MKIHCKACGNILTESNSSIRKNRCKDCWLKRSKEYREKYKLGRNKVEYQYKQAILRRSKDKHFVEQSMSFEEYKILREKPCYLCGNISTGIDRLDSSVGYTLQNSRPACSKCNRMKWEENLEDFLKHIRKILEYTANPI